ncbi:MAG: CDP-alcohol phosphatidyltransferase family protein [Longimicrobiales bacterium]
MSQRRRRERFNLPNAITAVRFPAAVLFPLVADPGGRLAILAAAAASEWSDGRLARAQGQVTRTGELLDPIADKIFVLVVLVTLGVEGRIPLWTLPLLLTRDIGVTLGAVTLAPRGVRRRITARPAGKLVTWLQFTAIGTMLLWPGTARWMAPVVAAAGLFALQDYARSLRRRTDPPGKRRSGSH